MCCEAVCGGCILTGSKDGGVAGIALSARCLSCGILSMRSMRSILGVSVLSARTDRSFNGRSFTGRSDGSNTLSGSLSTGIRSARTGAGPGCKFITGGVATILLITGFCWGVCGGGGGGGPKVGGTEPRLTLSVSISIGSCEPMDRVIS